MKTDVQKAGSCRVKLAVEATAEEIDPIYKAVQSAFTAQVKLPGFRPGKAPWEQIEKLHSGAIREEIQRRVVRKLIEASHDAKVDYVALVDIEGLRSGKGEGASATFVLDVKPEFKLPDPAKWRVKKLDETVGDKEIEERLASVRRMAASFKEATAEDVATEDDLLAISFTSNLDPEKISAAAKHYASDDEYWVQLREDAFIPGLKDALLGKKVGDKVALKASYPKDFRIEDLKGKRVNYDITVKSMRKLVPADDATVLARFGAKDMDELVKAVTDNLKAAKKYAEEERATKELCALIEKSAKFDLPERVLNDRIYDELYVDAAKPLETYKGDAEALRKSDAYKDATTRATAALRRAYVLLALAKAQNITLTEAEINEALDRLSQSSGLAREELTKRMIRNDRLQGFLDHTLENKMLGELLKTCAVL